MIKSPSYPVFSRSPDKHAAIHDRHPVVRDNNGNGSFFQDLHGITGVETGSHIKISDVLKGQFHQVKHVRIIINEKDGDHGEASGAGLVFSISITRDILKLPIGARISKRAPFPATAIFLDGQAGNGKDFPCQEETEPAVADHTGFKNFFFHLSGNANPVIFNN